jgi:signal transduction histidine kinase
MKSLHRRLLIVATIALSVALLAVGVGLSFAFERAMRARVVAELADQLDVLVQAVRIDRNGLALVRNPPDPRFERAYGGFYWQIGRQSRTEAKSRSLWDQTLAWAVRPPRMGETRSSLMDGPSSQELIIVERQVMIDAPDGAEPVRFLVGLDDNELIEARTGFFEAIIPALIAVGASLLLGLWAFLRFGLAPLNRLQGALADVRNNKAAMIEGTYPAEVMPLVQEVNALIGARNEDLVKARSRAGDLAHALKTPLAVLSTQVRELREAGQAQVADEIAMEIDQIDRVVRRELARARANLQANRQITVTTIAPIVARTCAALGKLKAHAALGFEIKADASAAVTVDETDLMEMVGNLIENAAKWAVTKIRVDTEIGAAGLVGIIVSDDGPGLTPEQTRDVMRRGIRLDETVQGTGLGLSIVRDLAEAYGGDLMLGRSDLGGLRAALLLPSRGQKVLH